MGNFRQVLDTVCKRYGDLLTEEEAAFADGFRALSQDAQRLFVRLISRKGPCFRLDRLRYPEIDSLEAAALELEERGFLDRALDADPTDLLPLLLRAELLEMADALGLAWSAGQRKPEILEEIVAGTGPRALRSAIDERISVVRTLHLHEILVYRLLFFGNLYQDWTEFVLRDLGVVAYESYSLDRRLRKFPTRRALDEQLVLRIQREEITLLLHAGQLEETLERVHLLLSPDPPWQATSQPLVDSILLRTARALERGGHLEPALELYAEAGRPPARERRSRILARLDRFDEAFDLCQEIASDPHDETEIEFGPRFAHQLRRKRGENVRPWRRRRRPTLELEISPRAGQAVEPLVLEALTRDASRRGFFSENWLWKSLFGLAFWDILFAPVPGAFHHPFQLGPDDFHGPEFRRARAEAIEDRLGELEQESDLTARLLPVYEQQRPKANFLVAWHEGLLPHLELAMTTVSGRALALVAERLSRDPKRYRRGLPDLFLTSADEPGFELLEVKAPGDQLRPEQGGWIDYLNDRGLPARIVKVRWA